MSVKDLVSLPPIPKKKNPVNPHGVICAYIKTCGVKQYTSNLQTTPYHHDIMHADMQSKVICITEHIINVVNIKLLSVV